MNNTTNQHSPLATSKTIAVFGAGPGLGQAVARRYAREGYAVVLVARHYLHIESDWNFATGAPVGLIHDAWSIRLVPYYGFGIFFVLLHLASGLRVVMLEHASSLKWANRVVTWGAAASAAASTLTLLGMCGMRLH